MEFNTVQDRLERLEEYYGDLENEIMKLKQIFNYKKIKPKQFNFECKLSEIDIDGYIESDYKNETGFYIIKSIINDKLKIKIKRHIQITENMCNFCKQIDLGTLCYFNISEYNKLNDCGTIYFDKFIEGYHIRIILAKNSILFYSP